MEIKKVQIAAFRNLKNVAYKFDSKVSIISGNNMKGKTNTLNAIYWCLCGVDMNGSNDNVSNMPYGENETRVKVVLDNGSIERIATFEEGKTTTKVYVNGIEKGSKTAENLIDNLLGISELALKDTKTFKVRRFLLNPLYYRDIAPSELRSWVISVLFDETEEEILKELGSDALLDTFNRTLAEKSKNVKKFIKDNKDIIEKLKYTKEFLVERNEMKWVSNIDRDIEHHQYNVRALSEESVSVDEAALELSHYYDDKIKESGLSIVLLEKGLGEDVWKEVCYPKLIKDNLPLKNGSTAEIIFVSNMFVDLLGKVQLPRLIDEGETLDNNSMALLVGSSKAPQFIITKVSYEEQEGVKVC